MHQLAIPVVYYKLKVQSIIYPLIIDLMQVKRSKISFFSSCISLPLSHGNFFAPFNLILMCRVDRVTESGGDVGRLNVVGGAEV